MSYDRKRCCGVLLNDDRHLEGCPFAAQVLKELGPMVAPIAQAAALAIADTLDDPGYALVDPDRAITVLEGDALSGMPTEEVHEYVEPLRDLTFTGIDEARESTRDELLRILSDMRDVSGTVMRPVGPGALKFLKHPCPCHGIPPTIGCIQ